jgi:hypothetical protein
MRRGDLDVPREVTEYTEHTLMAAIGGASA